MAQNPTFEKWRRGRLLSVTGEAHEAWHAGAASRDAEVADLNAKLQRATDLVRYARHFLHNEEAISDEEYSDILVDNEGGQRVARLEGYDKVKADFQRESAISQEVSDRHLKDAVSLQARIDSVADLKKDISSLRDAIADASKEMTHQQARIDRVKALAEEIITKHQAAVPAWNMSNEDRACVATATVLLRALEG